jgi:hypothetical protein
MIDHGGVRAINSMFSMGCYTCTMPGKSDSERDKAMSFEVEFSTSRYEWVHRRKPRGYSLWYFRMPDGFTFSQEGTFPKAKQAAAAHARQRYGGGVVRIQVCT